MAVLGGVGLVWFAHQVLDVTEEFGHAVRGFWRSAKPGPGGDRQLGQPSHAGSTVAAAGDRQLGQTGG